MQPTDALGRRTRFKRAPTGKRVMLTDRDVAVLRLLARYRYLRATHLAAFIKPKSEKRFIERLGDLYHETSLIDRPKAQWRNANARYQPLIYELASPGYEHLKSRGDTIQRVMLCGGRNRAEITPHFEHAMMIVDAFVEIELQTIETSDQRFVCVDEILSRMPRHSRSPKHPLTVPVTIEPCTELPRLKRPFHTHVVPDGLYGIEYIVEDEKRYRFWALECENTSPKWRSNHRQSSTALKQAAYKALIDAQRYKSVWGLPNLKLDLRRQS